jgi:hypothetical protein
MIQLFYSARMDAPPSSPWLVLIHQLPPKPPYLRVKVWRRLQAVGAVPIKNSVYVLPNTEDAREDFEWVLREIRDEGAEASLCEARLVDGLTDAEVQSSFRAAREEDYRELATSIRAFAQKTLPRHGRSLPAETRTQIEGALVRFRKRLGEIAKIDFFAASGLVIVEGLLGDLESRLTPQTAATRPAVRATRIADVQGRVWITRTGVHIDRMASAWLIRRFIDRSPRFKFVPSRGYRPEPGELRFDMFDADFTHQGDLCTFEVLLREFGLDDPALGALAELVHDIDMKESKFDRPETAGLDHLVTGIAWSHEDDEGRLTQAAAVFDALHAYFKRRKR